MRAALNLNYLYFDSYGNGINSTLAIFFTTFLSIYPFFVGLFYRRFTKLSIKEVSEFLARFGNAIEGLNFKRQGNAVLTF